MTAAVTRDLTVTYAGLQLGGSTDYVIDGPFLLDYSHPSVRFEATVILSKETEAEFLTAEAALLTAWRTRREALTVTLGATGRYAFGTGGAGFDAMPSIQKLEDDFSTGLSARYRVTVILALSANTTNDNQGRADSKVDLETLPNGQKILRVSGAYTQVSGDSARTVYENEIDDYCNGLLASFNIDYSDLIEEKAEANDTNTRLEFIRTYREIIHRESTSSFDDPAIVNPELTISVVDQNPGDSLANVRRATELMVNYTCTIDKRVTTDLKGKWKRTILPTILNTARNQTGATGVVVVVEGGPTYDFHLNRIEAYLRVVTFGSGILEVSIDVEDDIESGKHLVPVWDGNPFSRDRYQGPATHTRTIIISELKLWVPDKYPWSADVRDPLLDRLSPEDLSDQGSFVEMRRFRRRRRMYVGAVQLGGLQHQLVLEVRTYIFVRADPPRRGGLNSNDRPMSKVPFLSQSGIGAGGQAVPGGSTKPADVGSLTRPR